MSLALDKPYVSSTARGAPCRCFALPRAAAYTESISRSPWSPSTTLCIATPPAGTVTFLFTKIEGSTRLREEQPEQMQVALAGRDVLLRSAIAEQGGYVFRTVGDSFHAASSDPTHALSSAIAVQRRLAGEEVGREVGGLRVRIALHTGVAEQRDDAYFGPPLNRVARLLSAAHGGQVLLSGAVQALVRDSLPEGVSLRALGERRLKDLTRPEQIYQLEGAALRLEEALACALEEGD